MTTAVGENADPEVGEYAGVVSRGIAFLIDLALAVLLATIGFDFVVSLLSAIGVAHATVTFSANAIAYIILVPVVFAAYCAISWVLAGRTPGMFLLGVRVVRPDGQSLRPFRSVVRALAYWISAILMLGFIWIMFDERRQGFHDKIAGTFVVYDWRGRKRPEQVQ
jgi:uncharacterized RDD family membrane protein YckC